MSRKKKKVRRQQKGSGVEDRIRAIFGRGPEEPMPPMATDSLRRYHEYLTAHLAFPFAALCLEPAEDRRPEVVPVLVLRLRPAEEADIYYGLLAEIACGDEPAVLPLTDIQMVFDAATARRVHEYLVWFDEAPPADPQIQNESEPAESRSLLGQLLHLAVYCAGAGASTGAILATAGGAETAAIVGASVVGFLGMLLGLWYGRIAAPYRALAVRLVFFGSLGSAAGAMIGTMAGGAIVAYVGTIPGSIAGTLVGRWLVKRDPGAKFTWGIAGAFLGGTIFAFYLDNNAALGGAGVGLLLGLGGGAALLLFAIVALGMLHLSGK